MKNFNIAKHFDIESFFLEGYAIVNESKKKNNSSNEIYFQRSLSSQTKIQNLTFYKRSYFCFKLHFFLISEYKRHFLMKKWSDEQATFKINPKKKVDTTKKQKQIYQITFKNIKAFFMFSKINLITEFCS